MKDPETDLFGNAFEPLKDPRGRKSHKITKRNQGFVIAAVSAGWKQAKIATFLRCDEKTLRKYYSRELEAGATYAEGMALQVVFDKMTNGNLRAANQVLEMSQAQVPGRAPKVEPDEKQEEPLGKKAALEKAAQNPGGGWADVLADDEAVH